MFVKLFILFTLLVFANADNEELRKIENELAEIERKSPDGLPDIAAKIQTIRELVRTSIKVGCDVADLIKYMKRAINEYPLEFVTPNMPEKPASTYVKMMGKIERRWQTFC